MTLEGLCETQLYPQETDWSWSCSDCKYDSLVVLLMGLQNTFSILDRFLVYNIPLGVNIYDVGLFGLFLFTWYFSKLKRTRDTHDT